MKPHDVSYLYKIDIHEYNPPNPQSGYDPKFQVIPMSFCFGHNTKIAYFWIKGTLVLPQPLALFLFAEELFE